MGKLAGKVAIVTGASKGIGAGIAKGLAAEGASVVVNYSSSKEGAERVVAEITKKGGKAVVVQGDMSKAVDVERLFADLAHAPADDLADLQGVDAGAVDGRMLDRAEQVGGMHGGESTVAATERGSDRFHHHDVVVGELGHVNGKHRPLRQVEREHCPTAQSLERTRARRCRSEVRLRDIASSRCGAAAAPARLN